MRFYSICLILFLLQTRGLLEIKFQKAIVHIRECVITKIEFSADILDTSNVSISASDTIRFWDQQMCWADIVTERLGSKVKRGDRDYDSLLYDFGKSELRRYQNSRAVFAPELKKFSIQTKCDLKVDFDTLDGNILAAHVYPWESQPGFTHGLDFLFFFTGDSIRKVYCHSWKN